MEGSVEVFDCSGCGRSTQSDLDGTVVITGIQGYRSMSGAMRVRWLVHKVCISCAEGYYATWAEAEIPRRAHG